MRTRALATLAAIAFLCSGCGQSGLPSDQGAGPSLPGSPSLHAHPQAVEPTAGAGGPSSSGGEAPGQVSVGPSSGGLAQPVSDAEVRKELAASGMAANSGRAMLTPNGLAIPPADAPGVVQAVIAAGNQIAHLPYRFGGGHGTFEDSAYDCSGSVSFAFAAAGILNTTLASGEFETWGAPGQGKWITVFANAGHMFIYVAGLRFDTVALAQTGTRWSNRSATEGGGFAVRHPPGL